MKKILIMGALGQIGTELTSFLRSIYGSSNVIASDIYAPVSNYDYGPFEIHNCVDGKQTAIIVNKHKIQTIYNLPALLSFNAEKNPQKAFDTNLIGLYNTLEVAKEYNCAVFTPSTIGIFGPSTPKVNTPQETITRPITMYGITKVSGELLCNYYHKKYNLDTRGLRYPGIISYKTVPGGGTTDYAIDIFHQAKKKKHYTSYLKANTFLDMLYMPDAIHAAVDLMETDQSALKDRNAFNITAMSIDVELLAFEIKKYIPDFTLSYEIDSIRQKIADSWPNTIDDSEARRQWNWNPKFGLKEMVKDMIKNVN